MKFTSVAMRVVARVVMGVAVFSANASADARRVGDFALLDHTGKFHQLTYYGDQKAVIFVAHSAKVELPGPPEAEGVELFYINAMPDEDRQSLAAGFASSHPAILVDESQVVARSLGFERVGDMIVVDPERMSVVYRGSVADLPRVLPSVLAGDAIDDGARGGGEAIPYTAVPSVSYTREIVPILEKHCVSCHHDGGIGPWAMSDHAVVKGWSPMMREVVLTRRMPPGQVDPHVGKPLLETAGLSPDEKRKLTSWIDAGAAIDAGQADPLANRKFTNPRFTLGEPDLIFKVPAQSIPATGVLDYRYVPVQLNLDRDVWVRAMEFVPGDREVLHHVIAYVSSPADKTVRGRQTGAARGESVGGFAPGRQPDQFRDNSGRLLKKGSNLLLQMHYTTSGRDTVDETEVGIYLHEKPPAYVMSGGVAGQRRFLIPPHAKEHRLEGVQEIERDAYLYELNPHMHFRGKYMSYTAEYPDGTSEVLLSVPKYDFNWQFNYVLAEPLFLPAGTRLVARGAMDNSDRNPSNPDPSKPVHFGLQTKHEMFFGFTTLRYVGDTPQSLVAEKAGTAEPRGAR